MTGLEFKIQSSKFNVQSSMFNVQSSMFKVQSSNLTNRRERQGNKKNPKIFKS